MGVGTQSFLPVRPAEIFSVVSLFKFPLSVQSQRSATRWAHRLGSLCSDQQREEFGTSARVLFESTEQTGSFHDRVLLLDAAHHHAEMFRFHHDGDAVWF